ncbi:MAG TPA: hypothetical protein VHW95_04445 [Steroidobacteraceae bacterium]|jgi:hypothetical protein|nr:hypothetical protein [Steroidobacteraceae bacterium]
MIVTVTLHLIIAFSVVPVFVAMLVRAHRVMIVRSILRAGQRGGYTRHCNGRKYEQGRFPMVLTHGAVLGDGGKKTC